VRAWCRTLPHGLNQAIETEHVGVCAHNEQIGDEDQFGALPALHLVKVRVWESRPRHRSPFAMVMERGRVCDTLRLKVRGPCVFHGRDSCCSRSTPCVTERAVCEASDPSCG